MEWLRVVLDEGHCIRNMTSNQSKACIALRAERRWFVTGITAKMSSCLKIQILMIVLIVYIIFYYQTKIFCCV